MRKPKILLICDVKGWGGWERATKIKEYLSDEFDFDMMDGGEFDRFEQKSDVNFIHINELHAVADKFSNYFTKQQVCLPEMMKYKNAKHTIDRDYDLYYLMFHTMLCSQQTKRVIYGGGRFVSAVTGLPVVKDVFKNEKHSGNATQAFKYLSGISAGMVANNMLAFNELKELYDGPAFYTPRGVDEKFWGSDKWHWYFKEKGWEPAHKSIKPYMKGFDELPMREKKNYYGKDFTAMFVGKKGSGKGLNTIIQDACKQANIRLIVNERNYTNALTKEQMRDFYNQSHILVVASHSDGTPNPALEAAACGVPVLTNHIGNMPEFIKDGYNGFLVKRNIGAYVEKLQWLKKNKEKAEEMGKNARKTVEKNWTWKHSMEYERKALRGIFENEKNK